MYKTKLIRLLFILSLLWACVVTGEDPSHSQYSLSAWFAAFYYPLALTPMAAIMCLWSSVR